MASSKDTPHQTNPNPNASESVTPPAQHVWLAGLGALAKAQQEGSKAIEALVNDGLAFQRKSQTEAQQRLQEATERLSHLTTDFGQPASGRVDKLEHLFEDRVAKALHRLGMPSLLDIQMLNDRVTQHERQHKTARPGCRQKGQALVEIGTPSLGETLGQFCGQNSRKNCRQIRSQDFIGQRQKAAQ